MGMRRKKWVRRVTQESDRLKRNRQIGLNQAMKMKGSTVIQAEGDNTRKRQQKARFIWEMSKY